MTELDRQINQLDNIYEELNDTETTLKRYILVNPGQKSTWNILPGRFTLTDVWSSWSSSSLSLSLSSLLWPSQVKPLKPKKIKSRDKSLLFHFWTVLKGFNEREDLFMRKVGWSEKRLVSHFYYWIYYYWLNRIWIEKKGRILKKLDFQPSRKLPAPTKLRKSFMTS